MSRYRNLTIIAVFGFIFLASYCGAQTVRTGQVSIPISVEEHPIVLGQEQGEKKSLGLFERMKRTLANLGKDDSETESSKVSQEKPAPTQAVPTTPPKPVTTQDIRKSTHSDYASMVEKKSAAPPSSPPKTARENTETQQLISPDYNSSTTTQEESVYVRLKKMRETVFDEVPTSTDIADETTTLKKKAEPTSSSYVQRPVPSRVTEKTPPPSYETNFTPQERMLPVVSNKHQVIEVEDPVVPQQSLTPRDVSNVDPWAKQNQAPSTRQSNSQLRTNRKMEYAPEAAPLSGIDVAQSIGYASERSDNGQENRQVVSPRRTSPSFSDETVPGPVTVLETSSIDSNPRGNNVFSSNNSMPVNGSLLAEQEKGTLTSPYLELETIGASKAIVGQESIYRVRVFNRGGAAAEQVVLTVEIPNWIDILPPDVSTGTTSVSQKAENDSFHDFVWKVNRIEAAGEEQLVLHLIPRQRKTVDLKIRYDFRKPSAVAKIIVQEPIIEMDLQGPNEVLWGTRVNYKLSVRNTGNGDAENVRFELLQTGSDMNSFELPLLKAGEEQIIDVDVWTGKQDHVDINIVATGPYDLTAKAVKRVIVHRPNLKLNVETPELQFVGNPAEYVLRVRNEGTAPARNIELLATIPLGARYLSNMTGGQLTPQNQVVWNIDSIPAGGEFVSSVTCEPKREGTCKLDAMLSDSSGPLVSGSGSFNAAAIADLKMTLENPQGPIEVGQEAVFVINVTNRGTKPAEDVEVIAAFARGVEPFAIEGGNGTMNDGQVLFDKIASISAGQTITLKVKGKADRPGNHRIRAEVVCPGVNTHLIYEQATYFYQKQKGKLSSQPLTATTSPSESMENAGPLPSPFSTTQGLSKPLPVPSTANGSIRENSMR